MTACDQANFERLPGFAPACTSEREIDGWIVGSSLAREDSGGGVISKWEASRDFSTHFGIRIAYDTSFGPTPFLKIWHNYKSGDFSMNMPDGSTLSTRLSANYATSTTPMRESDIESLRTAPVKVEHTNHEGKWTVYETTGLPEAMKAGEDDLALQKQRLDKGECTAR